MNMIVSAAIAGAAIPSVATASKEDPIFAAIKHSLETAAASTAMEAVVSAESDRLHRIADEKFGPCVVEVPSITEPGTKVLATWYNDIDEAIPREEYPELNERYQIELAKIREAHWSIVGVTDEMGDEEYAAEWKARIAFAQTVPTTFSGVLAMIAHAGKIIEEHGHDAFPAGDCPLIESLVEAVQALQLGGQFVEGEICQ